MPDRYWVGGTGTWSSTNTANWSATSGGAGGASVPTAADSVFFDQAGTYTVTMANSPRVCLDITVSAGTVTIAGSFVALNISGSMSLIAATSYTATGSVTFNSSTTGRTITTNGVSIPGSVILNNASGGWTLGSALTVGVNRSFILTAGTFSTNNFNITADSISSVSGAARTMNLGSSTLTLNATNGTLALDFNISSGLTFNAGTSTINVTGNDSGITTGSSNGGAGTQTITFNNVNFTNTALLVGRLFGGNVFNNLSITGRNTAGQASFIVGWNNTVNGTFTVNSAATNASMRVNVRSIATYGTVEQVTFTCSAVSLNQTNFRQVRFASSVSGTNLGDAGGNANITFASPKTVYWNLGGTVTWDAVGWATSSGGTPAAANYPLPQDTAVFDNAGAAGTVSTTGTSPNFFFIGAVNMSGRTSAMTLNWNSVTMMCGSFSAGSGVTYGATGILNLAGIGNFTYAPQASVSHRLNIDAPSGRYTVQNDFTYANSSFQAIIVAGTFDVGARTITFNGSSGLSYSGNGVMGIAMNGGVFRVTGFYSSFGGSSLNFTFSGYGTIRSDQGPSDFGCVVTFGNVVRADLSQLTLIQNSPVPFTVGGLAVYRDVVNQYSATGATTIDFPGGGDVQFVNFSATGAAGRVLTLTTSGEPGAQCILRKSTPWNVGANSTNGGNNTNIFFTAGGGIDYINISNINGQGVTSGNFLQFIPQMYD